MLRFFARGCFLSTCITCSVMGQAIEWIDQFGANSSDIAYDITVDSSGGIYATGRGTTTNNSNFLRRYDLDGNVLWTEEFDTTQGTFSFSVDSDGLGNVYVSGGSDLEGGSPIQHDDVFLHKYDSSGNFQWTRSFGDTGQQQSNSVSADSTGFVFIGGQAQVEFANPNVYAFISKYDGLGNHFWTEQVGTDNEFAFGVAGDGQGNAYLVGRTNGAIGEVDLGSTDAFLRKYDADGIVLWTRQFGAERHDEASDVAVDSQGNVFVTGDYGVQEFGASSDVFLRKYNPNGNLSWERILSSSGVDVGRGVTLDNAGNVLVTGYTYGLLGPASNAWSDAFVAKFTTSGDLQWTQQFGGNQPDISNSVAADGSGNVLLAGYTRSSLEGTNAGSNDAFVAKLIPTFPADFDLSGNVDSQDMTKWALAFGASNGADADRDGDSDGIDFLQWQREYGSSVLSTLKVTTSYSVAIPEPKALALVIAAMVAFSFQGRRSS